MVGFGSVGAMDYFDLLAAVQAEHAPNGFDNLIDFQECKDPECGQMPDKPGQCAQRNSGNPQKQNIGYHQKLGIAAAAQNTSAVAGFSE